MYDFVASIITPGQNGFYQTKRIISRNHLTPDGWRNYFENLLKEFPKGTEITGRVNYVHLDQSSTQCHLGVFGKLN